MTTVVMFFASIFITIGLTVTVVSAVEVVADILFRKDK